MVSHQLSYLQKQSNFFELPHIFVVFPPGAGGNFISGILTRTLNKDLKDLSFSSTGNAHANSASKLDFSDIISFGLRYNVPMFNSSEEKFQHYKAEIEKRHGSDTDVKVSWSHDFSNIPLYKTLFPNCKILVVTHYNNKEQLTAIIQQELKNRLDPKGFVFIESGLYLEQWRTAFKHSLIFALGPTMADVAEEIANDFMNIKYRPLVTFTTINMMIRFYGLEHLVDPSKKMTFDYLNYCTMPRFVQDPNYIPKLTDYTLFSVGPAYKDCVTDDCVVMPYSVIMDNDLSEFSNIVETMIGKLDSTQIDFVRSNLDNYHTKQAPGLMNDPFKYYYNLAKEARDQIKCLIKN